MTRAYTEIPVRLAIVHPIPSPYREKLFSELATSAGLDLVVYYCAQSTESYSDWQFRSGAYRQEVLPGFRLGGELHFNPAIVSRLIKERPNIILVWGWTHPTAAMALFVARVFRIPALLFSDSPWPVRQWPGTLVAGFIRWSKKRIIGLARRYLAQGALSREYLLSLGAFPEQLSVIPINCVDTELLHRGVRSSPKIARAKEELGIRDSQVILYVGRIVSGKGVPVLLDAYAELLERRMNVALLVVGGGPEKEAQELSAIERNLPNVLFLGSKPYEELPRFYNMADCLVLPTHSDNWPLVLLEAMACGLPVVTTIRCGSVPDIVEGQGSGLVVEPGDPLALADAIGTILSLAPSEREAMSDRALSVAGRYDCKSAAAQLADRLSSELAK